MPNTNHARDQPWLFCFHTFRKRNYVNLLINLIPKPRATPIWMTMTTAWTRMTRTMPNLNPITHRRRRNPNELLHYREIPVL